MISVHEAEKLSLKHYPRERSLSSKGSGTFSVRVSVTSKLSQPIDVSWITVKASDLRTALESIPATAKIVVVPLLNGIDHIALLRDRFGRDKIVPATIAVETERIAPAQIVWRSPFARLNVSSTGRRLLANTVRKSSSHCQRASGNLVFQFQLNKDPCGGSASRVALAFSFSGGECLTEQVGHSHYVIVKVMGE